MLLEETDSYFKLLSKSSEVFQTFFEGHFFAIVISVVDVAEDYGTHFSKIIFGDALVEDGKLS